MVWCNKVGFVWNSVSCSEKCDFIDRYFSAFFVLTFGAWVFGAGIRIAFYSGIGDGIRHFF